MLRVIFAQFTVFSFNSKVNSYLHHALVARLHLYSTKSLELEGEGGDVIGEACDEVLPRLLKKFCPDCCGAEILDGKVAGDVKVLRKVVA